MLGLAKDATVLITGIAGFCGSHLAELLLTDGQRVMGIEAQTANLDNLSALLDRVELCQADLRDAHQLRCVVADAQPDYIYHLAGITKTPDERYQLLYEVNVQGTLNLLEVVRTQKPDCSLLITGSSAQYGLVTPDENPIYETHPFHPITHYAVSKAAQDLVGYRYWAATGLCIVRARAFNIIGSRQRANLVGSAFARQIVEIERGSREPIINVGNLDARRDFVDVRDTVRAYQLALERGRPGEVYNVCSGQARSVRALLEGLLALSTARNIEIRQDPARMQAADVPLQVGSYEKLQRRTGWQPDIPFERTLRDLLDYWRRRMREG